ncbi:hypothetical protein BJV78DRAFT_653289 [Lactifluus subvellereus]|nr:hypothetical protein BJV78DRAFT_653289 [Lactifluus subvellereus]
MPWVPATFRASVHDQVHDKWLVGFNLSIFNGPRPPSINDRARCLTHDHCFKNHILVGQGSREVWSGRRKTMFNQSCHVPQTDYLISPKRVSIPLNPLSVMSRNRRHTTHHFCCSTACVRCRRLFWPAYVSRVRVRITCVTASGARFLILLGIATFGSDNVSRCLSSALVFDWLVCGCFPYCHCRYRRCYCAQNRCPGELPIASTHPWQLGRRRGSNRHGGGYRELGKPAALRRRYMGMMHHEPRCRRR